MNKFSKDKLAINNTNSSIVIEDSNSINLEQIVLNTVLEQNNRLDWKSLYNKSILENILITSNSNKIEDPKTYKEVLLREDKNYYLDAMQLEVNDLLKSNTWTILPKPNRASIIKGR